MTDTSAKLRLFILLALLLIFTVATFAESQLRSKISRTRSDMRTIATSLESYHADHGSYPLPNPDQQLPIAILSTPVAYLTPHATLSSDLFKHTYYRPINKWNIVVRLFVPPLLLTFIIVLIKSLIQRRMRVRPRFKNRDWTIGLFIIVSIMYICFIIAASDFGTVEVGRTYPNKQWSQNRKALNYFTQGNHWILQSVAPDGNRDITDLSVLLGPVAAEDLLATNSYDSTNGSVSNGDIFFSSR